MVSDDLDRARPQGVALAKIAGAATVVLSVAALAVGLMLTRSLGDDVRATVSVSRSALDAISRTISSVDMVAATTADSLDTASGSVDAVSATVDNAVTAVEDVATFLESDLPTTIESVQRSMPAAIQTANAIDGTLSALSLFGVNYNPDEPFGESLARVNTALSTLPGDLRAQSETLRRLVPSARNLAGETQELSGSMDALIESLEGFTSLTADYEATISEAESAIEQTDSSVETTIWMMRALIIGLCLGGVVVGLSLFGIGNSLETLHLRSDHIEAVHEDSVEV